MKNVKAIVVFLIFSIISVQVSMAADKDNFSVAPKTNNGNKWRIAYLEGGEYWEYLANLIPTVQGLMELGWIEKAEMPELDGSKTGELWKWMANNLKSKYIQFVEDAHYSSKWDKKKENNLREMNVKTILDRVNLKKDIDLIIAMGTWAGQDLANNRHKTPTILLDASDPVAAGVIKSNEDSGFDHLHARVDPYRYERQVKIFHDIIGFKKLGIAYKNTKDGRSYAALDKVEKIARDRGFEIVHAHIDYSSTEAAKRDLIQGFHKLAKEADAIYVTIQAGINSESIPELVRIANQYRKPTFSMAGSNEVKYGFLLSISQAGFRYVGNFYAQTMAKILNGAKPREISQLFEEPPKIAINLKTAEIIGYDPPVDVLGASDEIFQEISH